MTDKRDSAPDEVSGSEAHANLEQRSWSALVKEDKHAEDEGLPESVIDSSTFDQLLDMDDEEDHEFSKTIVLDYFEQATNTFKDMNEALKKKDLPELSRLGHFLKGSSAAIGLKKVKTTCEQIQNIGNCPEDAKEPEKKKALETITPLLPQVQEENAEARKHLDRYYKNEE